MNVKLPVLDSVKHRTLPSLSIQPLQSSYWPCRFEETEKLGKSLKFLSKSPFLFLMKPKMYCKILGSIQRLGFPKLPEID
jgi:hypothetical protein